MCKQWDKLSYPLGMRRFVPVRGWQLVTTCALRLRREFCSWLGFPYCPLVLVLTGAETSLSAAEIVDIEDAGFPSRNPVKKGGLRNPIQPSYLPVFPHRLLP